MMVNGQINEIGKLFGSTKENRQLMMVKMMKLGICLVHTREFFDH
jgi:hypothetical protein